MVRETDLVKEKIKKLPEYMRYYIQDLWREIDELTEAARVRAQELKGHDIISYSSGISDKKYALPDHSEIKFIAPGGPKFWVKIGEKFGSKSKVIAITTDGTIKVVPVASNSIYIQVERN